MRNLGLGLVLLVGCSAGEAQPRRLPSQTRCRADDDCVLVQSLPTCDPCGTCTDAPRAVSGRWLEAYTRACAAERRNGGPPPRCSPCPPPPPQPRVERVAVCRARVCTIEIVEGDGDGGVDEGARARDHGGADDL